MAPLAELTDLTVAVEDQLRHRLASLDLTDLLQGSLRLLAVRRQSNFADRAGLSVHENAAARLTSLEVAKDGAAQLKHLLLLPARPLRLMEHHGNVMEIA